MSHADHEPADLILVEGADGILAIGTASQLDEWEASAGNSGAGRAIRSGNPDARTRELAGELLPAATEVATSFLRRRSASSSGEIRLLTRGADGRYTSSTLLSPAQLAGLTRLNPQLLVVQAAVTAVSSALGEIRESLDEVREGVEELLRAADAEQLGDVYGRHRILVRMVGDLADGHRLTTTDWEAIAGLGPGLEVGTEKLRRHLLGQLSTLTVDASPRARAKALRRMVGTGRMGDLLKLLVTAEETLALYQRLRLERVHDREPGAVEQTVASIRRILDENLVLDTQLAVELRRILNDVAVLRPAEGWDVLTRRSLDAHRAQLAADVEEFLSHRQAQAERWELADSARVRDAVHHYRGRAGAIGRAGRRGVAKGLNTLARRIDPT
ncbi:hypothetical protein [Corynebacterium halotolerans]|uniref:Uncharacterized protein n=1 Tax=Corynebacterium halotolerans YIM 70093 = DSM 44683 TaxID=1121362 RepID=M1MZJ4_9CORY|nr:hypothetical protein [Corynebacterium halotolerans]AGF73129.1 hypothetical protein A605_10645 [Corynebacterium halotolerans YIM 70093 = DSM 44683]